jgi:uncharacterized peroxidase-related enzyme
MLSEYTLKLPALTVSTASSDASSLLQEAQRNFGFVPNMFALMANSPGLLSTYAHGYAQFRGDSGFCAVEQEVIFLTISAANGCEYCVSAHSMVAQAISKVPATVTAAIRAGNTPADAKLAALCGFTRTLLNTRGLPSRREVEAFLSAGYSERQVLEIILAIALKTISNYSNHLLHTPLDAAFAAHAWSDPKAAQ